MAKSKVEVIASVCHEVNRAYCQAIGDTSQVPWSEAPEWQKVSVMKGVNYHLANPDSKPSDSHAEWMKEKVATGWVYGEKKDPDAKPPTHHCLVPFEQLPKEQQAKDYLFLAVVRQLEKLVD
jgi:hypothetical protein